MAVERPEEWIAKEPVSARKLNQQVAALQRLMTVMGWDENRFSDDARVRLPPGVRIGEIVTSGPNGEANFTDERYWVHEVVLKGSASSTDPLDWTPIADTVIPDPRGEDFGGTGGDLTIKPRYAVTNLTEFDPSGDPGSHTLETSSLVLFFGLLDAGGAVEDDGSAPTPATRYVMAMGGVGGSVDVWDDDSQIVAAARTLAVDLNNVIVATSGVPSGAPTPGATLAFHDSGQSLGMSLVWQGSSGPAWDWASYID